MLKISRNVILPVLLLFIYSCKEDAQDIDDGFAPTPYDLSIPYKFPAMIIPENNPLTNEGVELGRMLYYDNRLSEGGPMEGRSCSSCHLQSISFSTNNGGVAVLPHVNLGWNHYFLWNGKIEGMLEDVMLFEVEEFFRSDLSAIRSASEYPALFEKAFGTKEITTERSAFALAQFFRTLVSGNSKFDKYLRQEVMLSSDEMAGYLIFNSEKGDCFHCHALPLTTDNSFHNIGLDSVFSSYNRGRYNVTGYSSDMGLFKTPTLRNVELTGPYMHDGRFASLDEVVEFYNSGVLRSATLDPIMTKPGKEFGLELSEIEKAQLVAFLKTFTDTSYLNNEALGSPFE